MKLESGPAKTDAIWWLARTILFLGFALYFVYDGAIGYPRKNQTAAQQALQARPFDGKLKFESLPETPSKEQFERFMRSKPTTREQVRQALGQPTLTDGTDEYYVTRYGYGRIPMSGGIVRPQDMAWVKWPNGGKDRKEMQEQFLWAIVPTPFGLYFLYRFIKALTLRVVVDDEGMSYGGQRIAFADMVSLRDYNPKGWIDLYYKSGPSEKRLRLDNEKVKLFDEIVDAICQAKGFKNEVRQYAAQKAGQQTEKQAEEQTAADGPADEP